MSCSSNTSAESHVNESSCPVNIIHPRVDLVESAENFQLFVEMPGIDENSVDVSLEKGVLTAQGDVDMSVPGGYEAVCGDLNGRHYERSFKLSEGIDQDGIDATVKNGVLVVVLPKTQQAKSHRIPVRSASA